MKFAARDRTAARTLAYTSTPTSREDGEHGSAGWRRASANPVSNMRTLKIPPRPSHDDSNGASGSKRRSGATSTVTFLRGQEIFTPGEGHGFVYIVRTGCVRLYKTLPDRRSVNLGLLGPNTVFTQEDLADGIASGAVAEALVDSTLSVVATDELASIIADSPELAAAMVTGMSRRLTDLQTLVEHLLVRDTSVRLATTLIVLSGRFGRPTADGLVAITLPLTHQSLANMIGSNRVTVTRKLLDLQTNGYVRSLGRNAIAIDVDRLRGYAQGAANGKAE